MLCSGFSLIALTCIDLDEMLLPDQITIPLIWLGLLFHLVTQTIALSDAVIGACAGYLSLWSIYWGFKLFTGREGMGHGDFKLLAALGAWLGWSVLPLLILISSLLGIIVHLCLSIGRPELLKQPIPFGPYLAGAGWACLCYGDTLSFYIESVRILHG